LSFYRSHSFIPILGALVLLVLMPASPVRSEGSAGQQTGDYRTIDWIDLVPEEDLEILLNPPDIIGQIMDGSPEDKIVPGLEPEAPPAGGALGVEEGAGNGLEDYPELQRYQEALRSTRVVSKFDGQAVRIPGFVVPLEFDSGRHVTQFFVVPYFGACIHMPPPPPNQMLFAEYAEGFDLETMYDPVWISGVMTTTVFENETGTAAYAIKVDKLEIFTE
jgi:uncharacterized protein